METSRIIVAMCPAHAWMECDQGSLVIDIAFKMPLKLAIS